MVGLRRLLCGTAARQGDAEANLAEGRSLPALNSISQGGLERPVALGRTAGPTWASAALAWAKRERT